MKQLLEKEYQKNITKRWWKDHLRAPHIIHFDHIFRMDYKTKEELSRKFPPLFKKMSQTVDEDDKWTKIEIWFFERNIWQVRVEITHLAWSCVLSVNVNSQILHFKN